MPEIHMHMHKGYIFIHLFMHMHRYTVRGSLHMIIPDTLVRTHPYNYLGHAGLARVGATEAAYDGHQRRQPTVRRGVAV